MYLIKKKKIKETKNINKIVRFNNSHNLSKQAEEVENNKLCNFKFSKKEKMVLGKLSEFIKWGARYPVPKNSTQMKPLYIKFN